MTSVLPLRTIWIGLALFVVYGGLIPFHFTTDSTIVTAHLVRAWQHPFASPDTGGPISLSDFAQNALLFVPFGAVGWLDRGRVAGRVRRLLLVLALGVTISASVELLQLFTLDRITALADVCANTLGTIAGIIAAHLATAPARVAVTVLSRRGWTMDSALYPLACAIILVLLTSWAPFDVTLSTGAIVAKLKVLRADSIQVPPVVTDEGVVAIRWAIVGVLLGLMVVRAGRSRLAAAALLVAAAVALEASQLLIDSRMPSGWDAAVMSAGAALGIAVSTIGITRTWRRIHWVVLLTVATIVAATMEMLSPFVLRHSHQDISWMPFYNYYERTSLETVSHVMELMLLYAPIGFAWPLTTRTRRNGTIIAIVLTAAVAGSFEWLQGWIDHRYGDVTDVAVAILGAVAGVWLSGPGWERAIAIGCSGLRVSARKPPPPALADETPVLS